MDIAPDIEHKITAVGVSQGSDLQLKKGEETLKLPGKSHGRLLRNRLIPHQRSRSFRFTFKGFTITVEISVLSCIGYALVPHSSGIPQHEP